MSNVSVGPTLIYHESHIQFIEMTDSQIHEFIVLLNHADKQKAKFWTEKIMEENRELVPVLFSEPGDSDELSVPNKIFMRVCTAMSTGTTDYLLRLLT